MIKKFFLQVFTEPDNSTFCPVRILAIAGVLEFLAMSVHVIVKTGAFDMQAFGLGFAALIGGAGVALGLKKDSPTDAKQ